MTYLSNAGFASGLSSLLIVIIAWILALYLLKRYLSSPDNNTLALAVILVSVGSVWLAIAINFIFALTNIAYLNSLPYLLIVGWIPGVVGLATGYVFITIVKEEYTKPVMIIFGIFFVINMIISYILIPFDLLGLKIDNALTFSKSYGDLPNASTSGYFSLLSIISIIIILITSIFFLITAYRTSIPLVKARAGLLGIGLLLIAIMIPFDSFLPTGQIGILLIIRFGVVISLFIISISITLPKRIFKNLA